eukprot:g4252.t1
MQNLFATVLLEELGIVVENRREVLSLLSVVVVQDGESLNVLGVRIRVLSGHGNIIYYFPLEEVAAWARRTRVLLLGDEFNQTHFAHLEHHVDDEVEDSANVGGDYNSQESGQEVEQEVQLEEELEEEQEQVVPYQNVQLAQEVEQEHQIQAAQPVLGGIENIPQQQLDVVEGIAEGMVFVEEMPDMYGEQENVNPNIMDAPIQFVGIPVQEGVALGVLQEQVVNIQEPPALPPPQHDEIVPIDHDNGGEVEVEEVEEFEIQVVEVDGDGDVVMIDLGEGEGEVGEGIDAQEPQIGHRYPLRDTRARRQYREREQHRREREGDRNERGRRVRQRFR